jgi:putative aldouronate transport system substrate-binding protein
MMMMEERNMEVRSMIVKKVLPLMAVLALAVLMLSCGGKKKVQVAAGGNIEERMRNTTYEATWLFPGFDAQDDKDMVVRAINDKLTELGYPGLTVKLNGMDWGSWDSATPIVLSGGNYDLVFCPAWASFYSDAMDGGAWTHWDNYIDLIPEFARLLAPYREYLYSADPDDRHIYRIPGIKEYGTYLCEARWNKTVADKLGITDALRNIKTVYDLEPYLEMYKNAYGSRGMAVLAVDTNALVNCFMPQADAFIATYEVDTDMYRTGAFAPWFDEYIRVRKDWYAKGYIPDYQQTMTWDDLVRMYGPESFLVYFNTGKPGGEAELNQTARETLGFEWGTTFLTDAYITSETLMGVAWGINAKSENPEAVAFVYELFATNKELTNLINFGIEGTHYTLDDTATLRQIQPARYFPNLMWMLGNRMLCHRLPGEPENLGQIYQEINDTAIRLPNFGFKWPIGLIDDLFLGVYRAMWVQYDRSIQIGIISDAQIADIKQKLSQINYQRYDEKLNDAYQKYRASR